MKRVLIALSAVSVACATGSGATAGSGSSAASAANSPEAKLRADMRKLWEDHVTYTGLFANAAINGGYDANNIAERLLKNQDDIGNAIKPYYGDAAGNKLGSLLRDHILIAADLVKAAKAGDSAAQVPRTRSGTRMRRHRRALAGRIPTGRRRRCRTCCMAICKW
jgi:hypothetical protein